jgi:Anti-sigma factor NepR
MAAAGFYPEDRRAWLLAIGRRLRAEYDAVAEPVPPRLLALLKQLEKPAGDSSPEGTYRRPPGVQTPLPLDPDGNRSIQQRPTDVCGG